MPRSTRVITYGPEYEQLLLLSFADPEGKSFDFGSYSVASAMKAKVYAYWKALRTEGNRPDLMEKADLLSMKVDGRFLVVFRRTDAWDRGLLRAAMGLEKGFEETLPQGVLVAKSPTDELVERLKELRNAKQQSR